MRISKSAELQQAALSFIDAYPKIDADGLDTYNQEYFKRYLEKINYQTYLACHLLDIADKKASFKKVIDLGGGIGFQTAFLASLDRNWKVHYVDADKASFDAAQKLNAQLKHNNIEYHLGELSDVSALVDKDCLVISRDVIEHIYDLSAFFSLSSNAGLNVHNTAAIKDSILRNREFEAIHRRAELIGNRSTIIKSRDSTQSYFELREQYVRNKKPELGPHYIKALAEETRGLAFDDIDLFLSNKSYPKYHLEFLGSNTCDPRTGNWAERLLSKSQYQVLAGETKLEFHYPKYNTLDNKGMRKVLLQILNIFAQSGIHQIKPSFSIAY